MQLLSQLGLKQMTIAMQRQPLGRLLCLSLGLLLTSCRSSVPPKIEICIGDGFGGADCVEADGTKKYRAPTDLLNYWMTGEADESNYSAWCYQTSASNARAGMRAIEIGLR